MALNLLYFAGLLAFYVGEHFFGDSPSPAFRYLITGTAIGLMVASVALRWRASRADAAQPERRQSNAHSQDSRCSGSVRRSFRWQRRSLSKPSSGFSKRPLRSVRASSKA